MSKPISRPQYRRRQLKEIGKDGRSEVKLDGREEGGVNEEVCEKKPIYRSYAWASSLLAQSLSEQELREEWSYNADHVSTYAGCGRYGKMDGPLKEAELMQPSRIAFSPLGVLFWSERKHRVRFINENGEVETYVGVLGMPGEEEGPRREAKLNRPAGISFNHFGHLFIADSLNHRIRMVNNNTQIVSTVVGTSEGYVDGPVERAKINSPKDIAFDSSHRLIIADSSNNAIRILSGNILSTLIGSQPTPKLHTSNIPEFAPFRLYNPESITFLPSGELIIAESAAISRILSFSPSNKPTNLLKLNPVSSIPIRPTRPPPPPGPFAQRPLAPHLPIQPSQIPPVTPQLQPFSFFGPCALSLSPSGEVLLSEANHNLIYRLNQSNRFEIFAGSGQRGHQNGHKSIASFGFPSGLAFSPTSQHLFICDHDEHRIRKISLPPHSNPRTLASILSNFSEISKNFPDSTTSSLSPLTSFHHSKTAADWSTCSHILREVAPSLLTVEGSAFLELLPCTEPTIDGILKLIHGTPIKDQLVDSMAKLGDMALGMVEIKKIGFLLDWCLISRYLGLQYVYQQCEVELGRRLEQLGDNEVQMLWNELISFVDRFSCLDHCVPLPQPSQMVGSYCRNVAMKLIRDIDAMKKEETKNKFAISFIGGFVASMTLHDKKYLAESLISELANATNGVDALHDEVVLNSDRLENPIDNLLNLAYNHIEMAGQSGEYIRMDSNIGYCSGDVGFEGDVVEKDSNQIKSGDCGHLKPNFVIESGEDLDGRTMKFLCHDWVLVANWEMVEKCLSFPGFESSHRILQCPSLPPLALQWILKWIYTGSLPSNPFQDGTEAHNAEDAFLAIIQDASFLGFTKDSPFTHQIPNTSSPNEPLERALNDLPLERNDQFLSSSSSRGHDLPPLPSHWSSQIAAPSFQEFIVFCALSVVSSPNSPHDLNNFLYRHHWDSKWISTTQS